MTTIEIPVVANTEGWRQFEGCRMVGSDTMPGPLQIAGSTRALGIFAIAWTGWR
jgi:hypothetical protein